MFLAPAQKLTPLAAAAAALMALMLAVTTQAAPSPLSTHPVTGQTPFPPVINRHPQQQNEREQKLQQSRLSALRFRLTAFTVYEVRQQNLFVVRTCVGCGTYRRCWRRFRPAFYCLMAGAACAGIALIALSIAAGLRQQQQRSASAASLMEPSKTPLLQQDDLDIRCDPLHEKTNFAVQV